MMGMPAMVRSGDEWDMVPVADTVEPGVTDLHPRAAQRLATTGEMTSGTAHDLRNVLSVIDVGLQLAELNAGAADTVRRGITTARHGVDHGLRLASRLMAFANCEQVDARLEDANSLLRDFEMFVRQSAGPTLRVAMDLGTDIPKCMIDATQFQASILNLVINARDAAPGGGEVVISTSRYAARSALANSAGPSTFLRVSVADNGYGIDEEVALRIFEPFFTTKGERGTGLGLPQVCAFVRQAKGYIQVTSSPGEGARLDLFFPSVESK
jgi:signal transduction histidine kinase